MSILIKNINEIYTGEELIKEGWIAIEGNRITGLGKKNTDPDKSKFTHVLEARDQIALPGLYNLHTHAAMTLLRGYADDLPLQQWLEEKIWPQEAKLESEEIYWGTKLAILEMISTGTTAFMDMYFQMDHVATAVEESGIRAVLSEGLIEANDGEEGLLKSLEFCKRWQGKARGRIRTMLGPHAPYTCSREYLIKIGELARANNLSLHIHIAETRKEYEDFLNTYGSTPVQYLDSFGFFENRVLAAHCVYLDEKDMEIFAENDVNVAYNPGSNMKLGSGIAPVNEMLKRGINVGFGTDGTASNNNLDLIEEARMGSYLQKVNNCLPTALGLDDILKMLTINGAKALGLEDAGRIKEGYLADLVLVNIKESSYYYPHHNNLSNLFYAGNGRDVDTVIIDGSLVYKNKEFLTMDVEEIYYQVEKLRNKLFA
ncbi:MAG: amidohydrolase [Halanaerobiaceae bacterium]|nr:amidohydrolase [Halanaerobiaceae bacterium]